MPRDDSNDRIKLRNDLDIELWDRNLKITMIKVLKELVEKVGNLHKQVGNFTCNGNARIKNNEKYLFVDSLIYLAQLRRESTLKDESMKSIQSEIQREKNE